MDHLQVNMRLGAFLVEIWRYVLSQWRFS